jgi:hypothetical protein
MWLAFTALVVVCACLVALRMILSGAKPEQRPALLEATAELVRAWRGSRRSALDESGWAGSRAVEKGRSNADGVIGGDGGLDGDQKGSGDDSTVGA